MRFLNDFDYYNSLLLLFELDTMNELWPVLPAVSEGLRLVSYLCGCYCFQHLF